MFSSFFKISLGRMPVSTPSRIILYVVCCFFFQPFMIICSKCVIRLFILLKTEPLKLGVYQLWSCVENNKGWTRTIRVFHAITSVRDIFVAPVYDLHVDTHGNKTSILQPHNSRNRLWVVHGAECICLPGSGALYH